ncbi:aldehyde dehydrogenase family protein [Corynebacterium hiratae]|uniref:aldehyde dehydrogenase family protein n=1 Tax=Corynebacterium hiratae TaxID=3139423 RepID=UPI003F6E2C1B
MKTFTQTRLPQRVLSFLDTDPARDVRGTGEQHQAHAPFSGEDLFSFPVATAGDVEKTVNYARAGVGQGDRAAILLRLHDLVQENEELILDLIQAENGKSRSHAYDELMDLYNCARFYAVNIRKAFGADRHPGALPVLTKTRTQHYPLGVVGLISPWNYPLSLGVGDVLAALSAGNAVVHKPDSQTTLTAILLRRLAIEAGLPEAAWQLVPGRGAEVGDALVPLVDGLSFTGSTKAGKSIATQAAGRLIPTMLELGGKNPMLVLDDAPLKSTAQGAVRTAFSSSGQLCMSAERAYVHESVFAEFLAELTNALDQQVLGAAFSDAATIGSLTSQRQLDAVKAHVEDAVSKGATVVYGGKAGRTLGPSSTSPPCSPE